MGNRPPESNELTWRRQTCQIPLGCPLFRRCGEWIIDIMELSEKFFMETAGWKAMKEARALLDSRKVLSATWKDPVLKGVVHAGGRDYACGFIIRSRTDIENLCRCRDSREWGQLCHHSVAVGLEAVRKMDFKAGRLKPEARSTVDMTRSAAAAAPPRQKPGKILNRTSEPTGQTQPLSIAVELPPAWFENAVNGAKVSLTFFADTDGQRSPLGAVSRDTEWYVEEEDMRLLRALEEMGITELPSHLTLDTAGFASLLNDLTGHPRVSVVRGGPEIRISDRPWVPRCELDAREDGALELKMMDDPGAEPPGLIMGPPVWVRVGGTLRPVSPAASQLDWSRQTHVIPRGQISRFLNQQWPDLEATGQVVSRVDPDRFTIEKGRPQFHLSLNGGLARLQARLRCQYGVSFHTLNTKDEDAKQKQESSGAWIADEKDPFRYWTRDSRLEKQAVSALTDAGFNRIEDDGLMELRSQESVLPFLATVYPLLRKQGWNIELDPRLDNSLSTKVETIEPDFDFMSSGEDWFEMTIEYSSSDGSRFSEAEVHELLRSGRPWRKKPDGRIQMINSPMLEEFQEVLRDCSPDRRGEKYRLDASQAPFLVNSIREVSTWKVRGNPEDWTDPSSVEVTWPSSLKDILRDYQKTGTRWMYGLGENRLGGILADDMGLGKTLQTLTCLTMRRDAGKRAGSNPGPSMVVCPTSLVHNWKEEARRFVPDLKVVAMHGPRRESLLPELANADLIITSYALIQRDIDHYLPLTLDAVFVDEAQNIKNPDSKSARALRKLRASTRFALTGTPVENRIMDLWAIMDFVMPGYLGQRKDFQMRYEAPIAKAGDKSTAGRLRRRISPFLLRRVKSEVVRELPDRIDQIRFCDMSPDQSALYRSILESGRSRIQEIVGTRGFSGNQFLVFQTLMRLRQACCDVRLLGDDARFESVRSAKLELFQELVGEAVDGGHKVLVFSQFTSMLKLLREQLDESQTGYSLLQGDTRNRQKVIDDFRTDPARKIFLISLKAGGTGLNLTEADVVIHYDPWWNPAVEDQATSRAHRIGQDRVVTSYKLITRGTIEEKILHLQDKKRKLFESMVDESAKSADSLTWEDVQDLLDDSDFQ